ncbi:MAG: SH3 domain-containing protein [Synergistaceae bacterium]|jgi:hypothetical protein|nr:SH3 domain-containing protein [Synergistaceae bacterium]
MRWIVLALSLGAAIMSLIHGVFEIWISSGSAGFPVETSGDAFTWVTFALLGAAAIFALVGGVLAFNRRRSGGFFLVVSALLCFFAHPYTRYYGGIYLVGGILAFFLHNSSGYDDEEEDEEDYEDGEYDDDESDEEDEYDEDNDDEDDEEKDFPEDRFKNKHLKAFSYGKKRERFAPFGIRNESRKENRSENRSENRDDEGFSKLNERLRARSSKVCPACGASVGIDHKFCYTCGSPLHTSSSSIKTDSKAAGYDSSSVILSVGDEGSRQDEVLRQDEALRQDEVLRPEDLPQENASRFKEFQSIFPTDGARDEENPEEEEFPPSVPHRVFVKPAMENRESVTKHHLLINPDDSYQEFSNYTRRRKRRRHSLVRRILAPLILLFAIGGAAWFLLGSSKVREDELPVPLPIDPKATSQDFRAFPDPEPVVEEGLPNISIASPARGVVIGSNVNVRPNHSISGAAITKLNADTRVDLLDRWEGVSGNLSGPWFQIRTGGREGWIYGQYLQPLDGRSSTFPESYTAKLLKTFGASKEELTSQLGQPTRQTATTLTWPGLTVNFRGENEIVRLHLNSAKHILLNGVAVGIPEEQLYKNVGYPSDYKSGQLRYIESGNQGMSVTMKSGKIQSITVGNI